MHKKRDNLGSNIDEWGILLLILKKTTLKLTCSLAELLILLKTLPSQSLSILRFYAQNCDSLQLLPKWVK